MLAARADPGRPDRPGWQIAVEALAARREDYRPRSLDHQSCPLYNPGTW